MKDGVSLRAFQEIFHIGHRKAYALIARRMLRVRDPRISTTSLGVFCKNDDVSLNGAVLGNSDAQNHKAGAGYSWERVASLLGASLDQVQAWVATQQLRVVDTFISDKALEEFCRSCGRNGGPKLNPRLMEPKILDWLIKDYGIAIPNFGVCPSVSPFEKQALIARVCGKCRKQIRGNVYFAHIKVCKGAVGNDRMRLAGS